MDADDRPTTLNLDTTPLTPDEIAPLLDNLAGADGPMRTASLAALIVLPLSTGSWSAVADRLEPLLHAAANPESELLLAAVQAPSHRIRGLFHSRAESIADADERRDLVHALARAGDRAAVPHLLEDFRGENDYVRSLAAEHLSFFAVPEARSEFVQVATGNSNTDAQFWSAMCLAQLGEPESLERELTQAGLEFALPFMWGDPQVGFARLQGRGPWPAASQSMLERLANRDDAIVHALLAGYGEADAPGLPPEIEHREQEPAKAAELHEHALALRAHLERTFPNESDLYQDWEALAYLPAGDGATLVSHLWARLADHFSMQRQTGTSPDSPPPDLWPLFGGGNALVSMARGMGSGFAPDVESLYESFLRAQDHGQFADQIGWTASRSGMRPVVIGLHGQLRSDDGAVRRAATRMIEAAGSRAGDEWPPIYGGVPPPAPRRIGLGFGGTPSIAGDSTGGTPEETAGADQPEPIPENGDGDAAPARHDLGHLFPSFNLSGGAAPAAGPDDEADMAEVGNAPGATTDPPRTAHPRLHCPQVVTAGEAFDLEVGIARLRDPSVAGSGIERPEWSQGPYVLTVWVLANGFGLRAGEALRQHLAVTVEEPYPSVVLHLTPDPQAEDIVHRKIEVTYFIGSQPVGIASREVEVVRTETMVATTPPPPQPLSSTFRIPVHYTEPDLTVKISEGDKPGRILWTFETPGKSQIATPATPIETDLGRNPAEFATQLINRMNQKADEALSLKMRGIGLAVEQTTPTRFWEILREVAAGIDDRPPAVLIISQDPYVPWELALFEPPIDPKSAPFLGAQAVLGRWILPRIGRDKPDLPVEEPRMVGSMAILSGVYPEQRGRWKRLPHAEQEAADLKLRYEGDEVAADTPSVVEFLENPPAAEVFHFAGHAVYDPTSLENGLVLSDGKFLDAVLISGARLSPKPRPFVFLNACQAGSGYDVLGGYGGLVGALLLVGASAVVAPLWSVNDEEARKVSIEFYERAVDDELPPAEILRRQRARFGKDANGEDVAADSPVHLAYQYFGHPSMRLVRTHS